MRFVDRYPIVVTNQLAACRDFYTRHLGFAVGFESSWIIVPGLAANGLEAGYPLTDEPFGQRRFGFHDPAGVWIDVVEQIDPAPGFWDRYPAGLARPVG